MTAEVSLRRLLLVSAIVFVLLLAFLAGRVHAGADPTQAAAPAATTTPSDPYGGRDRFRNDPNGFGAPGASVVPGGSDPYGAPGDGSGSGSGQFGSPDADPPQTSAS
jgi:hypothetical protein